MHLGLAKLLQSAAVLLGPFSLSQHSQGQWHGYSSQSFSLLVLFSNPVDGNLVHVRHLVIQFCWSMRVNLSCDISKCTFRQKKYSPVKWWTRSSLIFTWMWMDYLASVGVGCLWQMISDMKNQLASIMQRAGLLKASSSMDPAINVNSGLIECLFVYPPVCISYSQCTPCPVKGTGL